jgi:hypothetical protein
VADQAIVTKTVIAQIAVMVVKAQAGEIQEAAVNQHVADQEKIPIMICAN